MSTVWNDAAVSAYGQRLIALRKERGLSRYKAARAMGVHNETLKDAEEGLRRPQEETRQLIGSFYHVDPDTLAPLGDLRHTSSIDRVNPTYSDDYPAKEGDDMRSRDDAERAQHLLMGLPPELRARAVDLIYRLTHQAAAEQLGLAGKARRAKEGTG